MPKTSHAAPLVIVSGKERRFFNSETVATSFLAAESKREDLDSCVNRLHKGLLGEVEKLVGCKKFNGIAAAQAELRRSFTVADGDTLVHREMRALHEAFRLVRHVTEVGEDVYFAKFAAAFARMECKAGPPQPDSADPVTVSSTLGTRRRRRNKPRMAVDDEVTDINDAWADQVGDRFAATTTSAPSMVAPASRGSRRPLLRGPSDEGAQPLAKKVTSAMAFNLDDPVVIYGLVSRPELRGQTATVVSLPMPGQPRYGVKLGSSGDMLLVKEVNFKPSIFSGILSATS